MYKPFLDEIDLTYTQYITMLALWEHESINVKDLGELLYLDSGTLTPVLKKLEQKNYIQRKRWLKDERVLMVTVTEEGQKLKEQATCVPEKMGQCMKLDEDEAKTLYKLLHKMMELN